MSEHDDNILDGIDLRTGHRQRVKTRFFNNYNINTSYDDYDLLELILFYSIPRKDVKPLAKSLLQKYGSLSTILSSTKENLLQNKGINENSVTLFHLIKATNTHLLKKNLLGSHVIKNWDNLLDYCFMKMAHESKEMINIIYLNIKNVVIKDEIIQEGSINSSVVHPREIIARCLDLRASAIVIVHNHPSGDASPSREDVEMTSDINKALASANIKLHDHVIVGQGGITSLKNLGLLK